MLLQTSVLSVLFRKQCPRQFLSTPYSFNPRSHIKAHIRVRANRQTNRHNKIVICVKQLRLRRAEWHKALNEKSKFAEKSLKGGSTWKTSGPDSDAERRLTWKFRNSLSEPTIESSSKDDKSTSIPDLALAEFKAKATTGTDPPDVSPLEINQKGTLKGPFESVRSSTMPWLYRPFIDGFRASRAPEPLIYRPVWTYQPNTSKVCFFALIDSYFESKVD